MNSPEISNPAWLLVARNRRDLEGRREPYAMPILAPHSEKKFRNETDELESPLNRETQEQTEAATSSHLVRMIDFFFALVLGQGLLRYSDVIQAPFSANIPVWIALVLIYYTVVRSFVAWHAAIETRRYKMMSEVRTTELWRVYIDVLIVALYAYMLFSAEPLVNNTGADIHGLLWAFPLLFVLYALWGHLRRVAWGGDRFDLRVLRRFCVLYTLIAIAYTALPSKTLSISDDQANVLVLSIALLLMALYRYINFSQGDDRRARWITGIPKPRIPNLRTRRETTLGRK